MENARSEFAYWDRQPPGTCAKMLNTAALSRASNRTLSWIELLVLQILFKICSVCATKDLGVDVRQHPNVQWTLPPPLCASLPQSSNCFDSLAPAASACRPPRCRSSSSAAECCAPHSPVWAKRNGSLCATATPLPCPRRRSSLRVVVCSSKPPVSSCAERASSPVSKRIHVQRDWVKK